MGKYFGTDGFRGEVNKNLTADHAFKIGRFLGWYYSQGTENKCKVVIGKDTRRSSYMFEYALAAGLTASGADAYLLHVTTTPSVSYIARTDDFACGIMITASHNPFTDNGIKLINSNGEKMDEEVIQKVEAYLDGEFSVPLAVQDKVGRTVDYIIGRNRYIGYVIGLSKYSFKNMKIGLDCANGSSWTIAKGVFDALGAKTFVINAQPDGLNVNKNCGSTHIEGLQKLVVENSLDAGFAFDGDADRCLCVDEKGNVVDGDLILYVLALSLKRRGQLVKDTVVTTVMSNIGLYKAFDKEGIGYEKTSVGDKFVYENMSKNGYCLGGEQSGHIILSKVETTGDGIVTAIKIAEAMTENKEKMSELTAPVKIYPQKLLNLFVEDKDEVMRDEDVNSLVKEIERELGDDGRILVRKSGTENIVRIMAEAKTEVICKDCVSRVAELIKDKGYSI